MLRLGPDERPAKMKARGLVRRIRRAVNGLNRTTRCMEKWLERDQLVASTSYADPRLRAIERALRELDFLAGSVRFMRTTKK